MEPSAAAGDCARAVGAAESHKLNASIETEDSVPFAFISLPISGWLGRFRILFLFLIQEQLIGAQESQAECYHDIGSFRTVPRYVGRMGADQLGCQEHRVPTATALRQVRHHPVYHAPDSALAGGCIPPFRHGAPPGGSAGSNFGAQRCEPLVMALRGVLICGWAGS